jgi:hypothetical protein
MDEAARNCRIVDILYGNAFQYLSEGHLLPGKPTWPASKFLHRNSPGLVNQRRLLGASVMVLSCAPRKTVMPRVGAQAKGPHGATLMDVNSVTLATFASPSEIGTTRFLLMSEHQSYYLNDTLTPSFPMSAK